MSTINQQVRSAIKKLIKQYITDTHSGKWQNCPLCIIFRDIDPVTGRPNEIRTMPYAKRKSICNACPNVAFGYGWDRSWDWQILPCIRRGNIYKKLDFSGVEYEDSTRYYVIDFWKQVRELIPADRKKYVLSPQLIADIIIIARNINKQQIKK